MEPVPFDDDPNDAINLPCDGTHPMPMCTSWQCYLNDAETLAYRRVFRGAVSIAFDLEEHPDRDTPREQVATLGEAFKMAVGMLKSAYEAATRKRCGYCLAAADGDPTATVPIYTADAALREHVMVCGNNPLVRMIATQRAEVAKLEQRIAAGAAEKTVTDALRAARRTADARQAVIDEATAAADRLGSLNVSETATLAERIDAIGQKVNAVSEVITELSQMAAEWAATAAATATPGYVAEQLDKLNTLRARVLGGA